MHKLCLLAFILVSSITSLLIAPSTNATSNEIIISQILVGGSIGDNQPTQEFISIYNNGDQEINITDWCVSNKELVKFACFTPNESGIKYYLPSHSYATVSSDSFSIQNLYQPDVKYVSSNLVSGSIVAGAGDNISLIDSTNQIVDNICWNQDGNECLSISSMPGGSVLQRQINTELPDIFLDTNTATDFKKINTLIISPSGIEEWVILDVCKNIEGTQETIPNLYSVDNNGNCSPPPVDVCNNLDGIQTSLPSGYEFDNNGSCQPDVCLNIYGLQLFLPEDMELNGFGNCVFHDECLNLAGIQSVIPEGYKKSIDGSCVLDILPINITELLPNAVGSDDGNEFIEIYNPNNQAVDLKYYLLDVGQNYEHTYNFPTNSIIQPDQYLSFSNSEIKFTLLNSSSRARIRAIDNSSINETPIYNDPDSGLAWAIINNIWQYTNQPTPGKINLPSATNETKIVIIESYKRPCKEGQYRNEETGRCRNIVSNTSNLVPCSEGQERNPATNRCRSVANSTDETGLKPCEANQERNPETNRCRKIASMPEVKYKPEQLSVKSDNGLLYLSIASIGAIAVIYGIWEWRQELTNLTQKLLKRNK